MNKNHRVMSPRPFPKYLGLPLIEDALYEVERNIQAPTALVFSSILAAISLASQGDVDVLTPAGQRTPTSLMLLTIANSGERKSSVESIFLRAVKDFQSSQEAKFKERLILWKSEHAIWEQKKKSLLRRIGKLATEYQASEEDERALKVHQGIEPMRPKQTKLLYEDATPEAMVLGLYQDLSSAGLFSSEGGGILNGRALADLSKLNAIWSGDSVSIDRVSAESFRLEGVRQTLSIMVQESAFKKYIQRRGEESRGSGFLARFLVCQPLSTQGTRFIEAGILSWNHCDKFSARLTEILQYNKELLTNPLREKKVIGFSAEARSIWLDNFNKIEGEIGEGGQYFDVTDHASKLSDNIARVAALLHYFEGVEGEISGPTVEVAIKICKWYSEEFIRIFSPLSEEDADAYELDTWFEQWITKTGHTQIKKNEARKHAPNKLRGGKRFDRAIDLLKASGVIEEYLYGRTTFLDLHPSARQCLDSSVLTLAADRFNDSRRF